MLCWYVTVHLRYCFRTSSVGPEQVKHPGYDARRMDIRNPYGAYVRGSQETWLLPTLAPGVISLQCNGSGGQTPQLSIDQLAAKFTPISLDGATGTPAVPIDRGGYDR